MEKRNGEKKWRNEVEKRNGDIEIYFGEISLERNGKKDLFHRNFAIIVRQNKTKLCQTLA
jgi:hypothetical protein